MAGVLYSETIGITLQQVELAAQFMALIPHCSWALIIKDCGTDEAAHDATCVPLLPPAARPAHPSYP